MKDLMREEIFLFGETFVASANGAARYWTGRLLPGVEDELRDEDGKLPDGSTVWRSLLLVLQMTAACLLR